MTRKQADAAFESLRRHASAIAPPTGPADAGKLLDRAVLTKLQRDAMVHYITVGPDNLALAYSVLKAGAATFAAARFASLDSRDDAAAATTAARERFASRMIALADALDAADPADRAARLLDAFTGYVTAGRERFEPGPVVDRPATSAPDPVGDPAGDPAGDLLEAAGIAYLIAQWLESPPRPAVAAPTAA